ncbi:MAG TPA: ribosome biogenesis GTP-binding protein YihA/YsxC [Chitinophagaceae bacterium]|nr:YihA family ribosome biogenesis GTP-binding protein [Chitinophagaceae bacterium]HMZ46016.1 ribosome biogenesis GTP-binding protein YihA/YsxC [Chitinophagaceae bacterium]HNE92829.1 ribosome biogenesis GTP-binding protein YihA/YsxC [Chitinophagaceae bacterium]HNF28729.1 ribosome biogenesis GTP-binding protein YihA/YsxC [Chitinophagaceae bacterium]HNJ58190.1 ribosome biogenesis GTP-binding protein YihA/YsxC [Chitinophagaceae bacterium]
MQIKTAKYLISSPTFDKCPVADKPEFAFIGRSNVGKSSLINMLVNQKNLAKTSGTPGKTQLINHFIVNDSWYLVDLPGYGYAKRSQKDRNRWEQMIEHYMRKRENLINVFVLIDSRHSPQKNDLDFLDKLGKWQIPFVLVFTKADKEKPLVVKRNEQLFLNKMRETWQFLPQSFITSTEKKEGRLQLLQFIDDCVEEQQ